MLGSHQLPGTSAQLIPGAEERGYTTFAAGLSAANGAEPLAEGLWFRLRLPVLGTRFVTVIAREGGLR